MTRKANDRTLYLPEVRTTVRVIIRMFPSRMRGLLFTTITIEGRAKQNSTFTKERKSNKFDVNKNKEPSCEKRNHNSIRIPNASEC